jgi:hypothetical protein
MNKILVLLMMASATSSAFAGTKVKEWCSSSCQWGSGFYSDETNLQDCFSVRSESKKCAIEAAEKKCENDEDSYSTSSEVVKVECTIENRSYGRHYKVCHALAVAHCD